MAAIWQNVRFSVGGVAVDVLRLLATESAVTTTANREDRHC